MLGIEKTNVKGHNLQLKKKKKSVRCRKQLFYFGSGQTPEQVIINFMEFPSMDI